MTKQFSVLGIGNPIMDIIAPVPEQLLLDHNITKGGMTLIDEATALTLHKALMAAGQTREVAGGSAANTLVGIASLGVSSAYMGKIASDDVGTRFQHGITKSGLSFNTAPKQNGATGRCMIAVTPDGERSMSTLLGVATEFSPADVDS
ncbi:MAG: PfkB family carbohydrate kinase, partial [Litorimonas sp.]